MAGGTDDTLLSGEGTAATVASSDGVAPTLASGDATEPGGAMPLVTVDPTAARDSLAVLRIESVADAPAFAEALAALLEALSKSSSADVTEPFLRARRVLGGVTRVPATTWSRGGPP